MVCCFFGHRDAPDTVEERLYSTLRELVNEGTDSFLVGNQGYFDNLVLRTLRRLYEEYPHISYYVVLAYQQSDNVLWTPYKSEEIIYPDGIEKIFPRYALSWRNRWMVDRADVVVTYITRAYGGAAKSVDYARRRNKRIINLAEYVD